MCVQQGEKQRARNALQAPWGVVVSNSWEPFLALCYLLTSLGKRKPRCILFLAPLGGDRFTRTLAITVAGGGFGQIPINDQMLLFFGKKSSSPARQISLPPWLQLRSSS